MQFADWQAATRPKVQGSWNLDAALGDGLDFFVLLSSVIGVAGGAEQANYAAANTFLSVSSASLLPLSARILPLLLPLSFCSRRCIPRDMLHKPTL